MKIGTSSHLLEFRYADKSLQIYSGMDEIEWGYTLNVARFPTYTGEVVQILSCYIDDVSITGTVQGYIDMEDFYEFFLTYISEASQGAAGQATYTQEPIVFTYPHRGWEMRIVPTSLPGYRIGRDVVTPEWRIQAFVLDRNGNDSLSDLVIAEAQIKNALDSNEAGLDTTFSIEGKIRFVDENPFSDPWTDKTNSFDPERKKRFDELADYYTSLLPKYLQGDFDALTGGSGSKPALGQGGLLNTPNPDQNPKGNGTAAQKKTASQIGRP